LKNSSSPREIAWELLAELFEDSAAFKSPIKVFVPLAEANTSFVELYKNSQSTRWICYQSFKPEVDALQKINVNCSQELSETELDAILFVPSKQRIESLGLLAYGLLNLKVGGFLSFCCSNQLGAGGFVTRIKEVFPSLEIESAKKCRYFTLTLREELTHKQKEILDSWSKAASSSVVPNSDYKSVPGIFGWNKIDKGSELLISTLPKLNGRGADLGAGYGYLSHQVLSKNDSIEHISLLEADLRSVHCAKENLKTWKEKCSFHWCDVTNPSLSGGLGTFDWIVMNPPFHDDSLVDQDLGKEFIRSASKLLKKDGMLYMVANSFLAYEILLEENFTKVEKVLKENGFKVFHVKR